MGSDHQTVIGIARNASTAYVGNREAREFYLPPSPRDAGGVDERLQPDVRVITDTYDREVEKISAAIAVIALPGAVAILLSVIGLAGLAAYTRRATARARSGSASHSALAPSGLPPIELASLSPVWRDPVLAARWKQK